MPLTRGRMELDVSYKTKTPPMGWNSYDCFLGSVNEEQVKNNADYMAKHLKHAGYEYIVIDIHWYSETEGTMATALGDVIADDGRPPVRMDKYGRLWPNLTKFPSSAGEAGFKPLADYIHSLGLKFGIHIMRGVHIGLRGKGYKIYGTDVLFDEIYDDNAGCDWSTDFLGVKADNPASQAWYDSQFELFAQWGIDFVKVDDASYPVWHAEIEFIDNAIKKTGRDILLSLSPGPSVLSEANFYKKHANMWRISGDFWDGWSFLRESFDFLDKWHSFVGEGSWPDADMIPFGHIAQVSSLRGVTPRYTRFSRDEQQTLMTLFCIARSPLMLGCDMPQNDEWTLSLISSPDILALNQRGAGSRPLFRDDDIQVWTTQVDGENYFAIFNIDYRELVADIAIPNACVNGYTVYDVWNKTFLNDVTDKITIPVSSHACRLLKLLEKS